MDPAVDARVLRELSLNKIDVIIRIFKCQPSFQFASTVLVQSSIATCARVGSPTALLRFDVVVVLGGFAVAVSCCPCNTPFGLRGLCRLGLGLGL
jgi:hypothetical protein